VRASRYLPASMCSRNHTRCHARMSRSRTRSCCSTRAADSAAPRRGCDPGHRRAAGRRNLLHQLLGQRTSRVHRGVTIAASPADPGAREVAWVRCALMSDVPPALCRAGRDRCSLGDRRRCRRRRGGRCDASGRSLKGMIRQGWQNTVVEPVRSVEQRFDASEELSGLALDDPVS